MIGVYFETWACPWSGSGADSALAKVEAPIDTVILSFVHPNCTYKKGQRTWVGTGLNFSSEFHVIQQAIEILKKKGIKVLLGVGGATYQFDIYNPSNVAFLMQDLDADGIDLDWEPYKGIAEAHKFGPLIEQTKPFCKDKLLSAAVFAYGVLGPQNGNPYRGVNTAGLLSHGNMLDFINVMAYDGGKGLDVSVSYSSYQEIFSKPIMMGFQVGKQGWGDAYLTLADVTSLCKKLRPKDGCFVWAYFKDGNPNCRQVVTTAASLLQPTFSCPNCSIRLSVTLAK
jgi:chitinase